MFRFASIALFSLLCVAFPASAQQTEAVAPRSHEVDPNWGNGLTEWRFSISPPVNFIELETLPNYRREFVHPANTAQLLAPSFHLPTLDTIGKMEAAFSCNDTPFIDQVRLPVAALWHGRLRLTGFESDVTTANFILGLPGAGTLANLSLTGSGHLATHAPPSDQLVGMHLTLSLDGAETGSLDNSGLRGLQYLARTGRSFFQSIFIR